MLLWVGGGGRWRLPTGASAPFPAAHPGWMGLGAAAFPVRGSWVEAASSGTDPAAESLFYLLSLKMEACFSFYPPLKKKKKKVKKATVLAELVVCKGILQRS